ncbi:MAG: HAMP domain-containing histidine kinase [Leptospiraceae bacterium]|nr:HAMP domain-containing histidine kinase [Leptospiraceae bacterium]
MNETQARALRGIRIHLPVFGMCVGLRVDAEAQGSALLLTAVEVNRQPSLTCIAAHAERLSHEWTSKQRSLAGENLPLFPDLEPWRVAQPRERRRRAVDRELDQLRDRLNQQSNSVARIVHDLRHPIAQLNLLCDNYLQRRPGSALHLRQMKSDLEAARRQLILLESLTHDIVHLSTGTAVNPAPRQRPLKIWRDVMQLHSAVIARKRLRLHSVLPSEDPPASEAGAALHRILYNLLANAVRFSPEGSDLYCEVTREGQTLAFSIEDSGPGPGSDVSIFELSRRNIGRSGGGWGIGLASALEQAYKIGAHLSVTAGRRGTGANFLLVLPLESCQDSDAS